MPIAIQSAASPSAGALYPFRPLFLCAALFASLGMLAWGVFLHSGWTPSAALAPIPWHAHAMLYGFAGALIGGFLLTATANWTGLPTTTPITLTVSTALWLAARSALLSPLPPIVGAVFDVAYLFGVSVLVGRAIMLSHNRRNLFVIGILLIYIGLDIAFYIGVIRNDPIVTTRALIGCVDLLTLLMLAIGGRVIPFFTTRRMPELALMQYKPLMLAVNLGAMLVLICGLCGAPDRVRGGLMAALSLLTFARLAGWRGWQTWREPMLWVLHLGYLWLAIGLLLRGLGLLGVWAQPEIETLHGITIGALGTLSLGMMTRVAQGHSGAAIRANACLIAMFVLPSVAAILRLCFGPAGWVWAALAWVLAFTVYLGAIGPLLLRGAPRKSTPARA